MTVGVVLAAGRSSRMGQSKALLRHPGSGRSFVAHVVTELQAGGVKDVVVVGRPGDPALADEVEAVGARLVVNRHPEAEQLSSLLAALDTLPASTTSVMMTPVDVPGVTSATVQTLLAAAAQASALIVRVSHAGRHGHPVIFKRGVFDELLRADPSVGARAVVRADPARVLDVEVQDPGAVVDVDTPADYERLKRGEL